MLQIQYLDHRSSIPTSRASARFIAGDTTISLVSVSGRGYRIVASQTKQSITNASGTHDRLLNLSHSPQTHPDPVVDTLVVTRHQDPEIVFDPFYDHGEDGDETYSENHRLGQGEQVLHKWYQPSPFRNASQLTILHPDGIKEPFVVDTRRLLSTILPKTVIYPVHDVGNTDQLVESHCNTLPDEGKVLIAPADGQGRTHIVKLGTPVVLPEQTMADRVLELATSMRKINRLRAFGLARKMVPTNPYSLIYFTQDNKPLGYPILATPAVALYPPITESTPRSEILNMLQLQLAMEWAAYGHIPGDFPFKHPILDTKPLAAMFVNAACMKLEPYVMSVLYDMLQTDMEKLSGPYAGLQAAQRRITPRDLFKIVLASFHIHNGDLDLVRWFPQPGVYSTPILSVISRTGERQSSRLIKMFWCRQVKRLHKLAVSIQTIDHYTVEQTDQETDKIWI